MRVQQVEESSPLFPPVGGVLLRPHGASFLGLRQHRVAPLKPQLRQKEVAAEGSDQEAQAEGPSGAGDLHGDTIPGTAVPQ